jgi:hypothetical protein
MIIGVAGTAKNTGKTTALGVLLREAHRRELSTGVTGIGYDGEERDTVTMLPKPRVYLETGTLVSTSASCLRVSSACLEQVEQTAFRTALGQVVILRVTSPGLVVVAGPNKTDELRVVVSRMQAMGAGSVFVDGSLNRIAPMVVAERLVFATGAARTTDVDRLVAETLAIERLFSFPRVTASTAPASGIQLIGEDVQVHRAYSAVQGGEEMEMALRKIPDRLRQVIVPGMVTLQGLSALVRHMSLMRLTSLTSDPIPSGVTGDTSHGTPVQVVFDDPFKLLLAGDPMRTAALLEQMDSRVARISYRHAPRLVAVTINPSYPAFDGTVYHSALLDPPTVLQRFRGRLTTPVADVFAPGGESRFCSAVFATPSDGEA